MLLAFVEWESWYCIIYICVLGPFYIWAILIYNFVELFVVYDSKFLKAVSKGADFDNLSSLANLMSIMIQFRLSLLYFACFICLLSPCALLYESYKNHFSNPDRAERQPLLDRETNFKVHANVEDGDEECVICFELF